MTMGLRLIGSTIMSPLWGFLNFNHYILSNKFDSPNLPPQNTKHGMTNKKNNIPNLQTSKLQTTKCQIHLFPRLSVSLSLRLSVSHSPIRPIRLIAHSPTRLIALSHIRPFALSHLHPLTHSPARTIDLSLHHKLLRSPHSLSLHNQNIYSGSVSTDIKNISMIR